MTAPGYDQLAEQRFENDRVRSASWSDGKDGKPSRLPPARLLRYDLKTVRAYLLKEAFQRLWEYNSPAQTRKFLDEVLVTFPREPGI